MKRIPTLIRAILVIIVAYLIFAYAIPPLLPQSLLIQFMVITIVSVLLYYSAEDARWEAFKMPLLALLRRKKLWPIRWCFLLVIPGLVGYTSFEMMRPSWESPVELRQVHPAPPSKLKAFGKTFNLKTLENPIRTQVVEQLKTNKDTAYLTYHDAVKKGSEVYFKNCFYCHGDLLDGQGPFAKGFNPVPANFQDVGTIAQLQEAFLFWRISTGGPGLPKEGTPWNSAMPVWHEMLQEDDVWNVITYLYDYVGQVPRMWDQEVSKAVTGMKDEILAQRANMAPKDIYQFRCAVCHGENGAGDGPAAEFLYPKPRDFTLGLFKYKTSPGTQPARDEDLFETIKHGLKATGMPGWSTLLSDKEINDLIPVLKSFDTAATWAPEDADDESFDDDGLYTKTDFVKIAEIEPVSGQIPYSADSIKKGKSAFDKACDKCHGAQGRGNITSGKKLEDDWGFRIWPRDLTKPWTWRATNVDDPITGQDETIKNIYQRLSIGILGTPMPAHRAVDEGNKDPISLEDRWHISNYVYSLREKTIAPGSAVIKAKEVTTLPTATDDPAWNTIAAVSYQLVPNVIKEDRLFTPMNESVSVRAMYNQDQIAFLLEINDRTDSRPGEPVTMEIQDENITLHSDAVAIQFPKQNAFRIKPVVIKPLYRHGDSAHSTSIWYWHAGSVEPVVAPGSIIFDATGPDKKLTMRKTHDLKVVSKWQDGQWRVLMTRPRKSPDTEDVQFDEGLFIPISFANWDGSNGEKGSKHTLTSWFWLLLPPEEDQVKLYGLPVGIGGLIFILGLLLVRSQRRREPI